MPDGGVVAILGLPPIVHAPVFVCLIWLLALALGRRLTIWLQLSSVGLDPWERGLVALTIGAGCLQFVPFALAAAHVMQPAVVRVAVLGLAALLLPDAYRALLAIKRQLASALELRLPPAIRIWAGILLALLALLFVHSLVFGRYGDDDGYHLSAPVRWLRSGTLGYLPTYTHTNASFGFEMLYVIALSFKEPLAAKLLHFSAGIWTLSAVLLCCRRLGTWLSGIMAISFLLIATPLVNLPLIFSLAFADFAACWAAMVGVLLWLVWRETREPALLTALALCAGLTGSFKFTALSICIAWACIIFAELRMQQRSWRDSLALLLRFGLIASVPVLPWLLRNWRLTGNPIYPMFPSVIPTRDWTIEHGKLFSRYIRYYSWGVASGARLTEGVRKALLVVSAVLVLAFAAALWSQTKRPALRILLALATVYTILCIALTGLLFRYWLPGVACFSVVAFVLLEQRLPKTGLRYAPALVLIALALGLQLREEGKRESGVLSELRLATGLSTPAREHTGDPLWQMWAQVTASTPPDARILVAAFYTTFGASSFGCYPLDRVCFTTDSHLQRYIRLDDWDQFLASVDRAKIQYLLLSDQRWTAGRHGFTFLAGQNEYPFCTRLASEYGEKVTSFQHLTLYRLRPIQAH
ncbi:MAG TPA: hypothetical protein VNW92_11000 [Polyangiaceae bacterium]|nr:hypothetical protein [Polyangiaceae bacterium]